MRTNWPAYVAAEMKRIVADEEAFERLVDLFKQAHGRAPASDCEAYQWAQEMNDVALTALGFEGRAGFSTTTTGRAWPARQRRGELTLRAAPRLAHTPISRPHRARESHTHHRPS